MWPCLPIANFVKKKKILITLQDYVEEAKMLIQDIDNTLSRCPNVTTFGIHCLMSFFNVYFQIVYVAYFYFGLIIPMLCPFCSINLVILILETLNSGF